MEASGHRPLAQPGLSEHPQRRQSAAALATRGAETYSRGGVLPDAQAPAGSLRDPLEESKGIDVLRADLTVTKPEGRCHGAQGWCDGWRVYDD